MVRGFALSFAVLLAVFEIGTCLKCYQCNTQANPECGDKLANTEKFKVDCAYQDSANYNRLYLSRVLTHEMLSAVGSQQFCVKVTDPSGTSARTCMTGNSLSEVNQLCANAVNGKALKACSYCNKELCNGSSAIASSLPVAFVALLATYLFYKQ